MKYIIQRGKGNVLIDGKEVSLKLNGRTPKEMTEEDFKKSKQYKTMTLIGFKPIGNNFRQWIKDDVSVWLKNSKVDRIRQGTDTIETLEAQC